MAGTLDPNASGEEVVFAVNELLSNPSAGVGGEESEIAFNNAVMIGDTVVFWNGEFLYSMYSASPDGANLTNDYTTVNSSNFYHGLRAGDTPTESTNPADYVWTEIQANRAPYYHVRTGRQVDWMYSEEAVVGFTLDANGGAIDLDAVTTDGEDGVGQRTDISYATIVDEPVAEVQAISVNSAAELTTASVTSEIEVQALSYDPTSFSNSVVGEFDRESVEIALRNDFNPGEQRDEELIYEITNLGSQTGNASDYVSWPTGPGTVTTGAGVFLYTPPTDGTGTSLSTNAGNLTYLGETIDDFRNSRVEVDINFTALEEGFFHGSFYVGNSTNVDNADAIALSTGSITVSNSRGFGSTLTNLESERISLSARDAHSNAFLEGEYSYEITAVRIYRGALTPASYSYNPDLNNNVFATGGSLSFDWEGVLFLARDSMQMHGDWHDQSSTPTMLISTQPSTLDSSETLLFNNLGEVFVPFEESNADAWSTTSIPANNSLPDGWDYVPATIAYGPGGPEERWIQLS